MHWLAIVAVAVTACLWQCQQGCFATASSSSVRVPGLRRFIEHTSKRLDANTVPADAWDPFSRVRDNHTVFSYTDYESVALADFTGDGKLDLVVVHDNGAMSTYSSSNELLGAGGDAWYVNVGTSSHAAFERLEAADAWFSEPQSGSAAMQLMDLDGDNKADVFHTNFTFQGPSIVKDPSTSFYANRGSTTVPSFSTRDTPTAAEVVMRAFIASLPAAPVHFHGFDWDADGDLDLLVTPAPASSVLDATTLYFYDNTGSATSPSFNATAPVATLALDGLLLSAHVIDMDGDGLLDVVGSTVKNGMRVWLHNPAQFTKGSEPGSPAIINFTDSTTSWSFLTDNRDPFESLDTAGAMLFASFGDIDSDGDNDMILGHASDVAFPLRFYRSLGHLGKPKFTYTGTCGALCSDDIPKGRIAKPSKASSGGSSDTDTVWVLDAAGQYRMYTRNGTQYSRNRADNPLRHVEVHTGLRYRVADMNGDGKDDVVGVRSGLEPAITVSLDVAAPGSPAVLVQSSETLLTEPSPAFADSQLMCYLVDVNADGLLDVVLHTGYVSVNSGNATLPAFNSTLEAHSGLATLFGTMNPKQYAYNGEFVDVDGDGDVDFVHGAVSAQTFKLFTNDGSFVFTEQASGGGNAWVDSNLITAGGPVGLSVRQRASSGVFDVVMTRYSKESVTLSWGIWNRNTNSFAATWNEPSAPTGDPDTCVGDLHVTPLLNDWDSDGDVDVAILCAPLTSKLALTAKSTVLHYITTDATDEARVYGADAGSSGLGRFGTTAGSYITTFAAGDVDSDGDMDFVQCEHLALQTLGCLFIQQQADGSVRVLMYTNPSNPFRVLPTTATPTLADVNADGLLDVVHGEAASVVYGDPGVFINTGSASAPAFDDNNKWGIDVIAGGYSRPRAAVADVDGDGRPDVILADQFGHFVLLLLDGSQQTLASFRIDPKKTVALDSLGLVILAHPAAVDLDSDGDMDLLVAGEDKDENGRVFVAFNLGVECHFECGGRGVCVDSPPLLALGQYGTCSCASQYAGDHCTTCASSRFGAGCNSICPVGNDLMCSGHGTCDDGWWGSGTCSCSVGYSGDSCERGGCVAGQGVDELTGVCALCLEGHYSSSASPFPCTACAVGRVAPSTGATDCAQCKPGSFQAQTGRRTCDVCAEGTAVAADGAHQCNACVAGRFANSTGFKECTKCPVGRFIDCKGSNACKPCGVGTYADEEGLAECKPCPIGKYMTTNGATQCLDCAQGRFASVTRLEACFQCDVGKYASGTGATQCLTCDPGRAVATLGAAVCPKCVPGSITTSSGRDVCDRCAAGTYAPSPGSTTCLACPSRTRSTHDAGSANCTVCIGGEVQPTGTQVCAPCAKGRYALEPGANLAVNCLACPSGAYCAGLDYVVPVLGYWRSSPTSVSFHACDRPASCLGIDAVAAATETVDNAAVLAAVDAFRDSTNATSASGRRRRRRLAAAIALDGCSSSYHGALCKQCDEGYGRSGSAGCGLCSKFNKLIVATGLLVGGLVVAFMVYRQLAANRTQAKKWHRYHAKQREAFKRGKPFTARRPDKPPTYAAMIKVLTSNLQVLSMATTFNLKWPSFAQSVFNTQAAATSVSPTVISLSCEFEDTSLGPGAMKEVLVFVLLPMAFVLLAALHWFLLQPYFWSKVCHRCACCSFSSVMHKLKGRRAPRGKKKGHKKKRRRKGKGKKRTRSQDASADGGAAGDGAAGAGTSAGAGAGGGAGSVAAGQRTSNGYGSGAGAAYVVPDGNAQAAVRVPTGSLSSASSSSSSSSDSSTFESDLDSDYDSDRALQILSSARKLDLSVQTRSAAELAAQLDRMVAQQEGGRAGAKRATSKRAAVVPHSVRATASSSSNNNLVAVRPANSNSSSTSSSSDDDADPATRSAREALKMQLSSLYQAKRRSKCALRTDKFIVSVIVIVFLLQATVVKLALSLFGCRQLDAGDWRLRIDLDHQCGTTQHTAMMLGVGLPALVVYGLGVPGFIFWVLYSNRATLAKTKTRSRFGFLYFGYERQFYYWEAIVSLRKILVLGVATFLGTVDAHVQALVAILVLVLALVLQVYLVPFDDPVLDIVETAGLCSSVLTLYGGLFLLTEGVLSDGVRIAVSLAIVVINILYLVAGVVLVIRAVRQEAIRRLGHSPRGRNILRRLCCVRDSHPLLPENRHKRHHLHGGLRSSSSVRLSRRYASKRVTQAPAKGSNHANSDVLGKHGRPGAAAEQKGGGVATIGVWSAGKDAMPVADSSAAAAGPRLSAGSLGGGRQGGGLPPILAAATSSPSARASLPPLLASAEASNLVNPIAVPQELES